MNYKLLAIILVLISLINGCNKAEDITSYPLDFFEVNKVDISNLELSNINKIIEEERTDNEFSAFLFTDYKNDQIKGGISLSDESYYIGDVSVETAIDDLVGIKEVQVFGRKAFKFHGVLGANYGKAYYWFLEEELEESVIHIEGHTVEIDLDDDGKNEIVSTLGTIPETKIYIIKEGTIYVSDIVKSMGAKSVHLLDIEKRSFEVYFEPNRPEKFIYYNGSLFNR